MSEPDIYFDGETVASTRSRLANVAGLLSAPGKVLAAVDGDAVGVADLANRVHQFAGDWHYGIGKLADYANAAVECVDAIGKVFDAADKKLAQALATGPGAR